MATLYRQYRPQRFSELIGQDHIRQTLQGALSHDRTGHAYLFAGPRGVGKTTVARLLAKAINCLSPEVDGAKGTFEPCGTCTLCQDITGGRCLDVMEIDAASNRGIDEIRELRDKIKFAPSAGKFKVFIIDEVHMLTKEAFNALLKTLEEPPAHAKFIMATTELHKVPVTITSRCQVFMFKKANASDLSTTLAEVGAAEGYKLEPDAIAFLTRLAGGSYRDGLSLLEQVRTASGTTITRDSIQEVLGVPSSSRIIGLFQAMGSGDSSRALLELHDAEAQGVDLDHLASELLDAARALLHMRLRVTEHFTNAEPALQSAWATVAETWDLTDLTDLISELANAKYLMKQASIPLLPLELVLVKFTKTRGSGQTTPPAQPVGGHSASPSKEQSETPSATEPAAPSIPKEPEVNDTSLEAEADSRSTDDSESVVEISEIKGQPLPADKDFWPNFLSQVRQSNMGLFGLLQQVEFGGIDGQVLTLRVPYTFTKDRIMDRKNHRLLLTIGDTLAGQKLELVCEVTSRPTVQIDDDVSRDPSILAAASEIFGVEEASAS